MSWLRKIAPKKFLWRYPLAMGALVVGILMCTIMLICTIATAMQVIKMKYCIECPEYESRNAYGYSCVAVIYCVFMWIASLWFLWGVRKEKASVVLGYLVVDAMWLAQTLSLLLVLIYLYSAKVNFVAWLISLICGLLACCILLYCLLVIYGFWLELKATPLPSITT